MSISVDQIKGSERLWNLAEQARGERSLWTNPGIREDLTHIAMTIEDAARAALIRDEWWSDAWADAALLTIRMYTGARKLIEHVRPS